MFSLKRIFGSYFPVVGLGCGPLGAYNDYDDADDDDNDDDDDDDDNKLG